MCMRSCLAMAAMSKSLDLLSSDFFLSLILASRSSSLGPAPGPCDLPQTLVADQLYIPSLRANITLFYARALISSNVILIMGSDRPLPRQFHAICDLAALVDHEVGECGAGEADDEGEGACESVFAVLGPHAGVGDVCQHVEDGVPVGCGLDVLFALASALHNDIFIYYVLPVSMQSA